MAPTETCKRETEITVPVEEVEKETLSVVDEIRTKARLPGFRPGKAPASLIRTKFRQEIRQDVLDKILPKAFRARAGEEHWNVVGTPNVTEVHFNEGEPLRFKAEFEVSPEFELGEYRGLEVPYADPQVSEEDIDTRIEELRNRKAEFVNEDPRPLQDGDFALVTLESLAGLEGEPIKNENLSLHIGDPETLHEFTENLRGVSPEESREFDVAYPADYGQDRLAGKTIHFRATVKGVRRREMPELNDEFARDLGDYKDLGELREVVRGSIRGEREHVAQQEAKNAAVDKLVELHHFPVPEAFLDRQIEMQVDRQLRDLAAQGVDPGQIKLDWGKLKEARRELATKDVRASLLLERIADAEAIHTSQDEVDRELNTLARREREPVAALRMKFEKDGTLARIAARIRTEKVLNYLFEHARKVIPVAPVPSEVEPAPSEEAAPSDE
ncbi:MAG: trigger factor [Bryobacteraceae bacterium]|nr:trigger factor [Bryobacteraceae bacterium]